MCLREPSDAELVAAYLGGERVAMNALVRRYHEPMERYVRHLIGNYQDSLDVYQNVWLRVTRTVGHYRPGDSEFFTWLTWQARSCASGFSRAKARHRTLPLHEVLDA